MTDAWNKLVKRMEELTDLYGIASLVEWDQAVLMPPKGGASRARASATLGGIMHDRLTDPAIGELLGELEGDDSLDDVRTRSVQLLRREYDRETKVPADLVRELTETTNIAYQVWTEARPASDFAMFEPHLKKVVELKKQQADAIGYEAERYDALLDLYEPGMTSVEVEAMFEELVEGLRPIVNVVLEAREPEPEFLLTQLRRRQTAALQPVADPAYRFRRRGGPARHFASPVHHHGRSGRHPADHQVQRIGSPLLHLRDSARDRARALRPGLPRAVAGPAGGRIRIAGHARVAIAHVGEPGRPKP